MVQLEQLHVGQLLSYNGHNGKEKTYSLWLLVKEDVNTQQSLWKDQPHPKRSFQLYNLYERYDALERDLIYYIFGKDQCRSFKVVNNAR